MIHGLLLKFAGYGARRGFPERARMPRGGTRSLVTRSSAEGAYTWTEAQRATQLKLVTETLNPKP